MAEDCVISLHAGSGDQKQLDDPQREAARLTSSTTVVSPSERRTCNRHESVVVWLVGLSGSGKSTLACALERVLFDRGCRVVVIDGDEFRIGVSAGLGFSTADRNENIRRAAEVAALFARNGMVVITAFICPLEADRQLARQILQEKSPDTKFIEVFLSASLAICEARDPKHLYARARAGRIANFTGISAPFEPPEVPDLSVDTGTIDCEHALSQMVGYLTPIVKAAVPRKEHLG